MYNKTPNSSKVLTGLKVGVVLPIDNEGIQRFKIFGDSYFCLKLNVKLMTIRISFRVLLVLSAHSRSIICVCLNIRMLHIFGQVHITSVKYLNVYVKIFSS